MVLIRAAREADAAAIATLYAPYVEHSSATFEELPPTPDEIARRLRGAGSEAGVAYSWLVAEEDGALLGYASSGCFRQRSAYRWSVETGVYVAPGEQRRGVARQLLTALLVLLERTGFVLAGTIRGPGYKLGEWVDIGYWQRDLAERMVPPCEPGA